MADNAAAAPMQYDRIRAAALEIIDARPLRVSGNRMRSDMCFQISLLYRRRVQSVAMK
jgi:hypothetical protein